MSFTPFLSSVAEALMQRVHPAVSDARSRDALEVCVRAIAGMAAMLETSAVAEVDALPLPADLAAPTAPLLVTSPPENLAANDQTAARIAAAAGWLETGMWLNPEGSQGALGRAMLRWERSVLRRKVAMIADLEHGKAGIEADLAKLVIDRDALERYLAERSPAGCGARITAFRQTVGGRSRQTAVFTLAGQTGLPPGLVVQRDHPASIAGFGVVAQYPVLELVGHSALKTSRPLLLETDRSVLGAPFMILEQAPGTVAGADYFDPPRSPTLALELAAQLAILHRVDPAPLAGTIGSTTTAPGRVGWQDDLARVEGAWRRFTHAPSLTVTAALSWMRAHVDAIEDEQAIIHNDAAFHNILAVDGGFSSLLDWELVHIGHPAEDLGYCRAFVQEITSWDGFMDAYVAGGGKRFPRVVIDYFSLRAGVHLITLLQYGRSMFINGVTSDINLAEASTWFTPKQHDRVATMLDAVINAT